MDLFLNSSAKMTEHTYRQRFTLIEMLIVVGIASLLFALLGPAFTRMTQSRAVEQHASGLKLGMERARARAIAQRRYVALLLPHSVTTATDPHYNYQRGGFKIGFITNGSENSYVFDGVVDSAEWTNRGNNAFLTAVANQKDANLSSEKPLESDFIQKEPTGFSTFLHTVSNVPSGPDKVISTRAIIFSPYGNVIMPGDDTEIYFYITGLDVNDCIKLRLNKLSGKVEYYTEE